MSGNRDKEDDQPVRPDPLHTDANVGDEGIGTNSTRSTGAGDGAHVNDVEEKVAKSENRGAGGSSAKNSAGETKKSD